MSKILWNELKTLYAELNEQRTKFKMNTVTVPSKENEQTKVSDISTLKDAIQAMTSHTQIGNEASTTSVIVPDQYSQMRQTPITQMRTVINRISRLTFNGTNFGTFNPNGSNFGSTFNRNTSLFSGHDTSRSSNFVMITYGFDQAGHRPTFTGNFSFTPRVCGRGVCFNNGSIN